MVGAIARAPSTPLRFYCFFPATNYNIAQTLCLIASLSAVVDYGFYCILFLWELRTEKASLHSQPSAISSITSLFVRNVASTFTKCVQGKLGVNIDFIFFIYLYHLTKSPVFSVSSPFNKARDFALWLWRAHNKVNERLLKEEETMGTADPKFPKMIWPPRQLCTSCYRSHGSQQQIEWDVDEVHKFLINYYGITLASLYKSNSALGNVVANGVLDEPTASTNAVAVPVGAALAIALASCAFGVLACYWRSQQKSRKYYHQRHSLKKYDY